ncbi:UbiD family decarboxylase [Candidatus Nitrosotenuis uzonensis]|uniref:Anhydromevalonate phosphate decarboxylase n=1 Tax=Candidatus Nitrosotenuis uzonensis TaxID=1407055 RepID=A0A812F2M5_9ARCH|nr:UbiD family decarboxylase [Candidatus Nitrosotenuis uzonensis]CAE6487690.1 UbiD family decarboxylase [Candidatus Nitrosotenuis uzonensis]
MTDIRAFIESTKKLNQLYVIKKRVSTKYEIAALTAQVDGANAILFENIKESRLRLVANLVGTRTRFAASVGTKESSIHQKVISAINMAKKPRVISDGKFFENRSKDISVLPIVTHFEKESGPFITSSIIYVQNPEKKTQNSSFHRLMPIDRTHFSIRMVEGRHLHRSFIDAKEHGEDLRVAITVGVHPAVSIAGAYQAEWGEDEMSIANSLLGGKLTLTKLPYSGRMVPSGTEIVMEGRILADKTHKEWMVEMLRTYDFARAQPVFELENLYFRNNAIFHDILSGYSEHRLLMGMPIESKLNRDVKKSFPKVKKVIMSDGGCNWLHAVVQISKTNDADGKKAIEKTFAAHRSLKMVTVVDEDIDPSDPVAVEYAMATRFQADKDLTIIKKVRGSSLDPSSDQKNLLTAKLGIDATRPLSKRKEGFEIAKIPKADRISLKDYI